MKAGIFVGCSSGHTNCFLKCYLCIMHILLQLLMKALEVWKCMQTLTDIKNPLSSLFFPSHSPFPFVSSPLRSDAVCDWLPCCVPWAGGIRHGRAPHGACVKSRLNSQQVLVDDQSSLWPCNNVSLEGLRKTCSQICSLATCASCIPRILPMPVPRLHLVLPLK